MGIDFFWVYVGYTVFMTKPMQYRKLVKLLRKAGFENRGGKGDHENWYNGAIRATIVHDTECSPKVVKDALAAIKEAQKNDEC